MNAGTLGKKKKLTFTRMLLLLLLLFSFGKLLQKFTVLFSGEVTVCSRGVQRIL